MCSLAHTLTTIVGLLEPEITVCRPKTSRKNSCTCEKMFYWLYIVVYRIEREREGEGGRREGEEREEREGGERGRGE